ncbi:hypothetical protein [Dyella flagellata]|uniref:Ricin B lectin domain-containing protein n=1 Tax=Dyella flagellata TaxID=1867833 RepID=A0ABQ5XBZ9_9GAMM|nr:hypothetical protein [Dyella flagellata]GLQ89163.1 hypothetical protein GCM10007898_27350 [Dyella flagellata]
MILYHITMGNGNALAIDGNNTGAGSQLILAAPNKSDPKQQWCWVYAPGVQASVLYNPNANFYAIPQSIQKNAPIVLAPATQSFTASNTFQVLGATSAAVRPPANTDLNMNALGDDWGPGTKVGLWSWDHGQPNEVWTTTAIQV